MDDRQQSLALRIESGAERLVRTLTARGDTVSCCESLTAGMLAAALGAVPGASLCLAGGLVTYQTSLKTVLAGVDQELIDRYGVVSPACAQAMAQGVQQRTATTWALSTTGVAGPGPSEGHPAGEAYVGLAGPGGQLHAIQALPLGLIGAPAGEELVSQADGNYPRQIITGDRLTVRQAVTVAALELLLARCSEEHS
ncbi:CinA family protein [Corynebacterium choanae]|uniref:Competence-damage inducible protein n=1 Tax=Corynebacterium choanae TaxID=1862358 RepID=A0A3G6J7J0_9CORY|nr:CinA family protein [Corynebacterium choanae]AZA13792.1 Putative competence-damage inducible protein [Corynebacterium choanae]